MRHPNRKKKSIIFSMLLLLISLQAHPYYVVSSVIGMVKISSGNQISTATKGTKVSETDIVSIPEGGMIKIIDEETSKEYQSISTGNMTVEHLISASSKKASDNSSQLHSIMNFPSSRKKVTASYVHRDRGMITRSLYLFDEEGASIEITPRDLARLVSYAAYFGKETSDTTLTYASFVDKPIPYDDSIRESGFRLHNPMETPVYFNVLKLSGIVDRQVEISPLGQPGGSYILPPGHTMWRTMDGNLPYGEKHVVVACHYSFDIDALIEALETIINDTNLITDFPDTSLPVFIKLIK